MYQKPGSSTARKKSYQTSLIRCLDFLDRDRVRRRAARVLGRHHRQLEGHSRDGVHPQERGHQHQADRGQGDGGPAQRPHRLPAAQNVHQRSADRLGIYLRVPAHLSMFQQPNGPARVHHASEEELRGIQVFHQQGHQNRNRHDRQHGPHGVVVVKESHQLQFTLHGHLVSWPVRAAESQLDVTSTDDYRKMREYEQETFLSMVKQVKNAGATLAI